jgi:hypothetical protein
MSESRPPTPDERRSVARGPLTLCEGQDLPRLSMGDKCGAAAGGLVCDREKGHSGNHRGYNEQIDEPMFWRQHGNR